MHEAPTVSETVVDRMRSEFGEIAQLLASAGEISLQSSANDLFRKSLLLAAASLFEQLMTECVLSFVMEQSPQSRRMVWSIVKLKAVDRQYHSWFDWDRVHANKFFSLFGEDFKKYMETTTKGDSDLQDAIRAFLEIGRERNRLVHQDFGSFPLEKTSDEIYELYRSATKFVSSLPTLLRGFCQLGDAANED